MLPPLDFLSIIKYTLIILKKHTQEKIMGKTIAQKIFESHMVEKPFEGTNILKLDRDG